MQYVSWFHRGADAILHTKSDRRREIENVLKGLPAEHPIERPHNRIRNDLEAEGWSKMELVSLSLSRKQNFDNLRDRIAIEIEFSRYEFVYRDYFRFLLAYHEDKIDIGVLIVYTDKTRFLYNDPNQAPSFEDCTEELSKLKHILGVPIWVVGLH